MAIETYHNYTLTANWRDYYNSPQSYTWPVQESPIFGFPASVPYTWYDGLFDRSLTLYCMSSEYPYGVAQFSATSGGSSPWTIGPNQGLYNVWLTSDKYPKAYALAQIGSTGALGDSGPLYRGTRAIQLKAINGSCYYGNPQAELKSGNTVTGYTTSSILEIPNCIYAEVGNPLPNTGTLILLGNQPSVFKNWTWPSTLISSGSQNSAGVSTATSLYFTFKAGTADAGTINCNYTAPSNPNEYWSPYDQNVVVHVLDDALAETTSSLGTVNVGTPSKPKWVVASSTSAAWVKFLTGKCTALSCASGGKTRSWYGTDTYDDKAYFLNVSEATFNVTPASGYRVYKWEYEAADGTLTTIGTANSVQRTGFASGCKIHLYLTTAVSNPKITYDGFDATGIVPADQGVVENGIVYNVGKAWTSTTETDSVGITLTPVAWAKRDLTQLRQVIIDGGTPETLTNTDGTCAIVTSDSAVFTNNRVKFKQSAAEKNGTLTLGIVMGSGTEGIQGVSVNVTQESVDLGSLTADGTLGYYSAAENGPLVIRPEVDYGEETPSDYLVTVAVNTATDTVLEGDSFGAGTASVVSTVTARSIIVTVSKIVNIASVSQTQINLTRDVTEGTAVITSATEVATCAVGTLSVTPVDDQATSVPVTVECLANPGYILKTILVKSSDETKTYASVAAVAGTTQIRLTMDVGDDGDTIHVILVCEAAVLATPTIQGMLPDDTGKFTAVLTPVPGATDYRFGDHVTLAVDPKTDDTEMPGIAIGKPYLNTTELNPARDGVSVTATGVLGLGANVFKIPVYATLEASVTPPAPEVTETPSVTWNVTDSLTIPGTTYYRLNSVFTVSVATVSSGYTALTGLIQLESTSSPFKYADYAVAVLTVSGSNSTIQGTLRGPMKCFIEYSQGTANPYATVAAYDYGAGAYITEGVRPGATITAVSPAILSENLAGTVTWPESTPGTDYETAAFLVVQEITEGRLFLPKVNVAFTSTVAARLEFWNAAAGTWTAYNSQTTTLAAKFNFFRVAIGEPPEKLVSVAVSDALIGANPAGCKIYATLGTALDASYTLPKELTVPSRQVLYIRATAPATHRVTGWIVNGVPSQGGVSLAVVVPDTGLTLQPQIALRTIAATSVMVLNGSPTDTDEGFWVSKLFRSQFPWRPLTAVVVTEPNDAAVTLGIIKSSGASPESLNADDPAVVSILTSGGDMRRLPPGRIQKSRFVRYAILLSDPVKVLSVAVGSGAQTMKEGH